MRVKWIEAISKHSTYNFSDYFTICEYHFKEDDFKVENKNKFLKSDAVPSLFDFDVNNDEHFDENLSHENTEKHYENIPTTHNNIDGGSAIVCKGCVDLQIDQIKAAEQINMLKKKVSSLTELALKQRTALGKLQKEHNNLQNEFSEMRSIQVR